MLYLRHGPEQLIGIAGTGLVFSWVTVTARCYVRAVMIKKFGLEDWFSLASLASPDCPLDSKTANNQISFYTPSTALLHSMAHSMAWVK